MPEVEEKPTEVETTKVDSPQEKPEAGVEAKPENGAVADTTEVEEKVEKKELEAAEPPVVELKGFETLEDGRVKLTIGGSTYFGKDADEAWAEAEKGIDEKNKSYQKTQEELRKLKAKASIREPEEEDAEVELPPQPDPQKYMREVFTERGLDPKMVSWSETQWDAHQDEQGLKDRYIVKLQNDIEAAKQEASRRFYADETKWFNLSLLKREVTPAVRDMVVDAGLEPDEFGEVYATLLQDPSMRYKNGEFNQTAILKTMHKKVVEKLKANRVSTTEVEKQKERLKQELDEKKKALQGGGSRVPHKPQNTEKPVRNLKDAFDPERWKNLG